jgi:hypothetical protein
MPLAYKSVRVIARKPRELIQPESPVAPPPVKTEQQIEREITRTVASWIDERREAAKEFVRTNSAGGLFQSKATSFP